MKIIFNRLDLPEEDKEKPIDELLNYFNDYWRDEYGISTMLFCRCEEIYFEDDNLDDLVSSLQSKGIIFTSEPEDMSYLWREAYLQDPDGNNIILFHAGTNRKNPPWRIN